MQGVFSPAISAKSGGLAPRDVFDDLQTPRPDPLTVDSAVDVGAGTATAAALAAQADKDGSEGGSSGGTIKALRSCNADSLGGASMAAAFEAAAKEVAVARGERLQAAPLRFVETDVVDVFATPRPGVALPFGSPQVQGLLAAEGDSLAGVLPCYTAASPF